MMPSSPNRTEAQPTTVIQAAGLQFAVRPQAAPPFTILKDLRVDVAAGEALAIFGRSGSGKTTLLNVLSGLDRPQAGRVVFEGIDLATAPAATLADIRRRRIGFVFQRFLLHGQRSATENVMLPMILNGATPAEARHAALDALEAVGLADRAHQPASRLSGGQCQRVAIARAMAHKPALILADEPTGNLDADTAVDILRLLRRLCNEQQVAMILTTHDDLVAAMADRSLRLADGRLVELEHHAASHPAPGPR